MRTLSALLAFALIACGPPSADQVQSQQQASIINEATRQTGMPAIVNFRERKLAKLILELRDQNDLVTYTYTFSENTGEKKFFCQSVGYGLPYAVQYTNPQHIDGNSSSYIALPQADPNGLFSPDAAEGTWVMCQDSNNPEIVKPVYVEPRVIVSPFKLPA